MEASTCQQQPMALTGELSAEASKCPSVLSVAVTEEQCTEPGTHQLSPVAVTAELSAGAFTSQLSPVGVLVIYRVMSCAYMWAIL